MRKSPPLTLCASRHSGMAPGLFLRMKRSLKKSRLAGILCCGLLLISGTRAQAQAPTISYPVAAGDLTRAYGQSELSVKLVFNGSCSGASEVRVALPASVNYLPGTVLKTGGSAGLTITESNISDLRNPVFTINGSISTGNEITFSLSRKAGCGTLATAKDSIYVRSGAGCSNTAELAAAVNTYNIFSPSLTLNPPAPISNAVIGTSTNRSFSITNGGNGAIDTLRLYIVYPGGAISNTSGSNAITANGNSFTPFRSNGDSLFYKIYGSNIFGGDNLLSNGETVAITEPIRVMQCGTTSNVSTYGASWGQSESSRCQTTSATSAVTMAIGVPVATITSTDTVVLHACSPGIAKSVISNTGNGGNAGALYNVKVNFGLSDGGEALQITGTGSGEYVSNPTFGAAPGTGTPLSYTAVTSGSNGYLEASLSQFSSDPDGPGGLSDLDGDGQFDDLAPGASITVYFNRNYINNNSCPRPAYAEYGSVTATYTSMCGNAVTTLPANGRSSFRYIYSSATRTNRIPPQIYNGVPFSAGISHYAAINVPANPTVDSLYLKLSLPAGVSYVPGSIMYRGVAMPAANVSISGNTVLIARKMAGVPSALSVNLDYDFQLVYDCSAGNNVSIPFEMYYVSSRDCGDALMRLYCGNLTTTAICPAPCPGGMGNIFAKAERTTLGWTDATMTTRVNPASLPAEQLTYVMSYDSVRITNVAKQSSIAFNNIHFNFELDKVSGQNTLIFGSGTYYHKSATSGAITTIAMPAPTDIGTANHTQWDWNLTGLGGLPATLGNNDRVWVEIMYQVGRPASGLYGTVPLYAPNAHSYFYSNDPGTGSKAYCLDMIPDLKFIGQTDPAPAPLGLNATLSGCEGAIPAVYYNTGYSAASKNLFYGEFRPSQYVDSIVYILPDGISYDATYNPFMARHRWTDKYNYTSTNWIIPAPIINGNRLTFINPGNWPMSEVTTVGSQVHSRIYFKLVANCAASNTSGAVPFQVAYYGKDFYYGQQSPAIPMNSTLTTNSSVSVLGIDGTRRPSLTVQNNSGTVQGVQTGQYWDVTLANPSSQAAPYVWLALEKGSTSGIVIDSIKNRNGTAISNSLTSSGSYGIDNKWYQVNASGINSGASNQYRVYFRYTNCNTDSIQLKAGWNCTGYPAGNPTTYACTAAQTWLKVIPQPSQVQLSVLRQPGDGGSIDLCTTDSVLLIVNSAQAANLVNPYITFYPPAGLLPSATIQVEYPLGSGNYQPASVSSLGGGGYKIDLSSHTAISSSGMSGTATTPGAAGRQAKVRLDFSTNCGFASGSSFNFNAYGNMPCNAPANGNGISATTNALNINGATASGSAGMLMDFGSTTTLNCGSSVTIAHSITPTGTATVAGDTVVYSLPAGLSYGGNLTAGFTARVSGQEVRVAIPAGIAAGTSVPYHFDINTSGGGCGSVAISATYQRSIAALNCGGTPCSSSTIVIANGTSPSITLNKPMLNISNATLVSGDYRPGGTYTAAITVGNSSSLNASAGYQVEAFCGSNTAPFAVAAFPAAVPAGNSATAQMNFSVPAGICDYASLITYKIRPLTAAGMEQCMCNETSFTPATALPFSFTSTAISINNCKVNLEWDYKLSGGTQLSRFAIERSAEGSIFAALDIVPSFNKSYMDEVPYNGNWFYRIKAIGADGTYTFSKVMMIKAGHCSNSILKVYPNPASGQVQVILQGGQSHYTYELSDALGRIVQKGSLQPTIINTLQVRDLVSGAYLLKIFDGTTVQVEKINIIR